MTEILCHDDGSMHQFMPKVDGKFFRCSCGCNVFHKRIGDDDRYICNACLNEFTSTPLEATNDPNA